MNSPATVHSLPIQSEEPAVMGAHMVDQGGMKERLFELRVEGCSYMISEPVWRLIQMLHTEARGGPLPYRGE